MRAPGKKKINKAVPAPQKGISQEKWVQPSAERNPPKGQAASQGPQKFKGQNPRALRSGKRSPRKGPRFAYEPVYVGDAHLAQDIKEAIRQEMFLSQVVDRIEVIVENRVVTLEGQVFSKEERMLAADKAEAFVGYKRVNNHLDIVEH